jgi:hypothetical protein
MLRTSKVAVACVGLFAGWAAGCGSDGLRRTQGRIEVTPPEVRFGEVRVLTAAESFVSVRNTGNGPLTVRSIQFNAAGRAESGQDQFAVAKVLDTDCDGAPRAGGTTLAVQECARFAVRYLPVETKNAAAVVTIDSDDPQTASVGIAVSGTGVEGAPGCDAGVKPTADVAILDGVRDITGLPVVASQTDVTFDGAKNSRVPRGEAQYAWRLVSQPANGAMTLTGTDTPQAGLVPQLDGEYVVELIVSDGQSCPSEPRQAKLTVSSDGGVHIEVTWVENHGDVDLHYIRPGGTFADRSGNTDCFFANCKRNDYLYGIDWGGPEGSDPLLDADKIWGNGPENVTVDKPTDGLYSVVAHYYCARNTLSDPYDDWSDSSGLSATSSGPVTVSVKVFFLGRLFHEATRSLTQRDMWRIGWVRVTGGLPAFVSPGDVGAPNLAELEKSPPGETPYGYRYSCTDDDN